MYTYDVQGAEPSQRPQRGPAQKRAAHADVQRKREEGQGKSTHDCCLAIFSFPVDSTYMYLHTCRWIDMNVRHLSHELYF